MRAVKGLKPKGHDCIMVRGEWKREEEGGLGAWVVGMAFPAGIQEEEKAGLQTEGGEGGFRWCSVWKC